MFERIIYSGLWFVILAIIGVGGWYAYKNLNHDFVYKSDQVALNDEVDINYDDGIEISEPSDSDDESDATVTTPSEPKPTVQEPVATATPSGEHAEIISELNKLIADNINMKVGSRGTRVGTVQKFLNVFLDTNSTIDNDFGTGTKEKVMQFQKSVGLGADGLPGPQTYQKMIDWLNNH